MTVERLSGACDIAIWHDMRVSHLPPPLSTSPTCNNHASQLELTKLYPTTNPLQTLDYLDIKDADLIRYGSDDDNGTQDGTLDGTQDGTDPFNTSGHVDELNSMIELDGMFDLDDVATGFISNPSNGLNPTATPQADSLAAASEDMTMHGRQKAMHDSHKWLESKS